ncbi:MAG TPA: DUF3108 domain-containing protein [Bacteroidia bacterium]|nr:DUF3108 domain-containing protein [Bacteroidia bacterium]HNT80783.1 DUF3108 domain-containing protein [Bacteroidia bacterium]
MKTTIVTLSLLIISSFGLHAQGLRNVKHNSFAPGEVLKFRIHYGFIDAGEATLEVNKEMKKIGGRSCYNVVGKGKSVGAFDWFFKVRDHYESYIDAQSMLPWLFIRKIDEGGYKKNQNVSFNHYKNSVKCEEGEFNVPDNVQDLISAFYYARTLDMTSASKGTIFEIEAFLDDEIIPLHIKYVGTEKVKTKLGYINCIVLKPMLVEGRVFKEKEDMTIWVSNDANKIPVRVQTNILVGSIKMDLVSYSGLANPIAFAKK